MAREYKPGQIVPQSGVYTTMHDPVHADMPREVTVIRGRRFPTCRHCKGITFQLSHAAKHVSEIDHLEKEHAENPSTVKLKFPHSLNANSCGAPPSGPSDRSPRMDTAAARCRAARPPPAWEKPNTLARYFVCTEGVAVSQTYTASQPCGLLVCMDLAQEGDGFEPSVPLRAYQFRRGPFAPGNGCRNSRPLSVEVASGDAPFGTPSLR
jgi:hypothetical protein